MKKFSVSKTKDYLLYEGKPFFYLADTVWFAFTSFSLNDWEEYLDFRKMQGFNVLQIIMLPMREFSFTYLNHGPFRLLSDDPLDFDFYMINEEYFEKAKSMLDIAAAKGFIPALAPLWCNYIPENWNSTQPKIPFDAVRPYIEYVVKNFDKYNPIYIVGGDTDFPTGEQTRYYMEELKTIKKVNPEAFTTFHIWTGTDDLNLEDADLPKEFIKSELDFYMYQSGHYNNQSTPYFLAEKFYRKEVKRPVVNGEPCYEGSLRNFTKYNPRFNEFDVRKAIWQSLLSGAKAGFAYGALGMYGKPDSEEVNNWRDVIRFPGAWDAAFSKWIFEEFEMFDLEPDYTGVLSNSPEIRMSRSIDGKKVVIYIPYNTEVEVGMDLSGYKFTLINMKDKLFAKPTIDFKEDRSVIRMHRFNADVLLIGNKNK